MNTAYQRRQDHAAAKREMDLAEGAQDAYLHIRRAHYYLEHEGGEAKAAALAEAGTFDGGKIHAPHHATPLQRNVESNQRAGSGPGVRTGTWLKSFPLDDSAPPIC